MRKAALLALSLMFAFGSLYGQVPEVSPSITWTVSAGYLPPGLSLSSAGKISGVPTLPGTYQFTVKALDPAGNIAYKSLSLVVAGQHNTQGKGKVKRP